MKIIRKNFKFIIGLLVGIAISCSAVFASSVLAGQISYKPLNSLFRETTVEGALNSLYDYAEASASLAETMNKPNTWPVNEEIDFGDGLFGQRFVGNMTAASSSIRSENLLKNYTGNINIVDCGGSSTFSSNTALKNFTMQAGSYISSSESDERVGFGTMVWNDQIGKKIYYSSVVPSPYKHTTSDTYDIWMLYTKS